MPIIFYALHLKKTEILFRLFIDCLLYWTSEEYPERNWHSQEGRIGTNDYRGKQQGSFHPPKN